MRVGSTPISSNPASARSRRYSASSRAPATHPTHSSMLLRTAAGTSPRTTTSDTANRPPGLRTRKASRNTWRLSAERLITQFEMITFTDASGRGMCSISPFRNSTFATPAFRWFSRAAGYAARSLSVLLLHRLLDLVATHVCTAPYQQILMGCVNATRSASSYGGVAPSEEHTSELQ